MSTYRINTVNNLGTYFAPKGAGLTAAATNYRVNGADINTIYMGRDNRAGNAVTAIASTGYRVGGVDIVSRFNRINPVFQTAISGSVNYNKTAQTPTISAVSPTNAGSPTIAGSAINAGTYTPASFSITVPSGYIASNSGTFTINKINIATGYSVEGTIVEYDGFEYQLQYILTPLYSGDYSTTITITSGAGIIYLTGVLSNIGASGSWASSGGVMVEPGIAPVLIGRRTDGLQTNYQISNSTGNYNTVNITVN